MKLGRCKGFEMEFLLDESRKWARAGVLGFLPCRTTNFVVFGLRGCQIDPFDRAMESTPKVGHFGFLIGAVRPFVAEI
jgi:hypothetical protein